MVYKLGHEAEINKLPFPVEGRLYDDLFEFLIVLDNEYGSSRDVDREDGGYVLLCTPGTAEDEIKAFFDFALILPEWTIEIPYEPEYTATLYMVREDYAVVLIMPSADLPVEIRVLDRK